MKILSKDRWEPLAVTAVSIIARAAHLFFFLIIGNKYGASSHTDFVIYMLAPLTVLSGVVSGAADVVVMPVFHKSENHNISKYIFQHSVKKIIKFILPLSFIIILSSSVIVQRYDCLLSVIIIFIPLFSGLASLKSGVLNASNRFQAAISGPLFGSLTAIIFFIFVPVNIYSFAFSFLLFEFGKFFFLSFFHDVTTKLTLLRTASGDKLIKWGFRNAKWQLLGSFIFSLVYPIDIWFASTLGPGSATFVEYANKLWNIVPLLFVGHITITYSAFSKAAIKGSLSINIHKIAIRYLLFGIFVSLLVVIGSDFIISLLYGHGKMTLDQQTTLSDLLKSYLVGAGPHVGGLVYVRAMSAIGRTDLLLAIACFGSICNIIFDALFIRTVGLNGIGLATSAIYLLNFLLLAYFYEYLGKNKQLAI